MAVDFNPTCPDGSHEDGTCVTNDPEDVAPCGHVIMPADAWNKIQQIYQKSQADQAKIKAAPAGMEGMAVNG